jgi:acyl-CoA synthetase (AMP-forming)/AMP-acid ligase II
MMPAVSYVHGTSDVPLTAETISACFDRIVHDHTSNEALVSRYQGLRYTYARLHEEVELLARGLLAIGLRKGDRVCAWIKPKPGETIPAEEIRSFCRGKIARYKISRYGRFVDDFPMTVTGTIQKYRMREIAIEELNLRGAANVETA